MSGCPCCGGVPSLLGRLAALVWLKCRNCGYEWAVEAEEEE